MTEERKKEILKTIEEGTDSMQAMCLSGYEYHTQIRRSAI